jgi:hypothetical protein
VSAFGYVSLTPTIITMCGHNHRTHFGGCSIHRAARRLLFSIHDSIPAPPNASVHPRRQSYPSISTTLSPAASIWARISRGVKKNW